MCLFGGCGGENITKAGGIVTCDGKPLSSGTIKFYPIAGGRSANAPIQADGTFTLSYRRPGDGLPPGEYKVAVISTEEIKKKGSKEQAAKPEGSEEDVLSYDSSVRFRDVVPRIYHSIKTTPLTQTIPADGKTQSLTIDVPSK